MDRTTEKNKILVLGRADIDKASFVDLIIAATAESSSNEESSQIKWHISTRYFDAAVEFWIDNTEELSTSDADFMSKWLDMPLQHNGDDANSSNEGSDNEKAASSIPVDSAMATLQEHLSDVVDAIVFIFDPLEPDSFLDILPWARMAKMYEPEVLLCVAWSTGNKVRVDSGKKDSWFEWCISNGWEWVDLTDDDPETEYTVDRVREALVSNQWSTMVMKQLQSKNRDSDKIDSVSDAVDVAKPEGARELTEWDAFDKIAGSIDDTRIKDIHRRFLADGEIGAGAGAGAGAGETLDFGSPENDSDGQGDEFSTIVSRIRAMRVEISQMTDKNEARKRAAEMAMVLTNFGR